MKKIIGLFFVVIATFSLAACGKKEFANDGVYTAFEVTSNDKGEAQVTWVDVTVSKGKITKYFIDALQSKVVDGSVVWNEKSKKELGDDYGMVDYGSAVAEWYEQAESIEAFFLSNGTTLSYKENADGEIVIDGIANVTIKDGGYSKLAKAAVENAKGNVSTAFEVSVHSSGAAQVTWVNVSYNAKGRIQSYFIDALQSKMVEGKNVWNAQTKKELGDAYGMVDYGNAVAEWDKQAESIEAFFLANGTTLDYTLNDLGDTVIDGISNVTIKDGGYSKLAKAAVAKIK